MVAEDCRPGVVSLSAAVARAEGLGTVLKHFQTVSLSHLHNPRHGSGVAVEVDGQNRSSAFGDGGLELVQVQVEGALVHVDKNGRRADGTDGFGGCEKTERGGNYFVARPDAEGAEADKQGVGAGIQADCVFDAEIARHFLFEGPNLFTQNELARTQDTLHGRVELVPQLVQLRAEVQHRNRFDLDVGAHGALSESFPSRGRLVSL